MLRRGRGGDDFRIHGAVEQFPVDGLSGFLIDGSRVVLAQLGVCVGGISAKAPGQQLAEVVSEGIAMRCAGRNVDVVAGREKMCLVCEIESDYAVVAWWRCMGNEAPRAPVSMVPVADCASSAVRQ